MSITIKRNEENVSHLLSQIEQGYLDPAAMPRGSVIQRRILSRSLDYSTSSSSWSVIDKITFSPILAGSLLRLSINYSVGAQAGSDFLFRFTVNEGANKFEIERTGVQRVHDTQIKDALESRFQWEHYHECDNVTARTYYVEGMNFSNSGLVWFHTYGSSATSWFTIEEIKQ